MPRRTRAALLLMASMSGACGAAQSPRTEAREATEEATSATPEDDRHAALLAEIERGVWGWPDGEASCEGGPHAIDFSDDRRTMQITHATPDPETGRPRETIYDIDLIGDVYVRGRIRGEQRRTDEGKLVVWDLVLVGEGAYCWHRTDWPAGGCTQTIRRCPGLERLPVPE